MVDQDDPAFKNPTKPVGAFYLKEEADLLARVNNFIFKEDPRKRGWRRVVPSPKPIDVLNRKIIKNLVDKGNIVIASGGGGVPVYLGKDKNFMVLKPLLIKTMHQHCLQKKLVQRLLYTYRCF